MEPTSLSASALQTYMDCPAHYKVSYIDRVRISSGGGSAGDLGSCIHEVLEWWIVAGRFENATNGNSALLSAKLREIAPKYGLVDAQIKVATKMLFAWYDRWVDPESSVPFEVMMAEVKETFPLKVKDPAGAVHEIPVTYIWDRVDLLTDDGSIRVVDYKSWMKSLSGDEIFSYPQVRLYALAAAIRYKQQSPPYIWVQLDQLRYGAVAVRFSRDDIKDIWAWLKTMYLEILASNGEQEIVGDGCRWCVRSVSCVSFQKAVAAGTIMTFTDAEAAARKVAEINSVMGALKDTKDQLLTYLETYLEEEKFLDQSWNDGTDTTVEVKITPTRKRDVDQVAAKDALGVDMRYGKITLGEIDELLAGDEIDDDQKDGLRRSITEGVTTSVNAKFKKVK